MKKYLLTMFIALLFGASQVFAITGNGTVGDPFIISDEDDLLDFMNETTAQNQGYWVAGTYTELAADLDMSSYNSTTTPSTDPIGTNSSSSYKGNFDGKGHVIRNLDIDLSITNYVGLFGYTDGANISNLGVEDASIMGNYIVGIFCGYNNNYSTISNCYATGSATGNGSNVGGFCGRNENNSTISDCYATGTADGKNYVGGFCGLNLDGTISDCYATGSATGTGDQVGGFCGYNNNSTISNCYATGIADGTSNVGGFCGYNNFYSTIENCYAIGSASGTLYVGGFCGKNESSTIENCYSAGSVTGSGSYVGGFCGRNYTSGYNYINSTISNCYATGSADGDDYVGGFCGYNGFNSSTISYCYSIGEPSGSNYVGGFVGEAYGGYTCCYWNTETSGTSDGWGSGFPTGITGLDNSGFADQSIFETCGFDFAGGTWIMTNKGPVLSAFVIPTLTEWAVIIFIGLLAGVGSVFVWRRA